MCNIRGLPDMHRHHRECVLKSCGFGDERDFQSTVRTSAIIVCQRFELASAPMTQGPSAPLPAVTVEVLMTVIGPKNN
jgi:hypothetical protein